MIYERYLLRSEDQPAFVRQASPFEDYVVRCVRYAFANISPKVGRVFFGKNVGLPWMRWRMLRHGYLKSPVHFREYRDVSFLSPSPSFFYRFPFPGIVFTVLGLSLPGLLCISKGRLTDHGFQKKFKGVWAIADPSKQADIIVYYAHGECVHRRM